VKRVRHPLDDEHQPRRLGGRHQGGGIESADRLGILQTPGIGLHRLEEHFLVRDEADRDENERAIDVQTDDVDGCLPEQQPRVEHGETRLDTVDVIDDQRLKLARVRQFPPRDPHSLSLVLSYGGVTAGRGSKVGTKAMGGAKVLRHKRELMSASQRLGDAGR
jgi:hypothetical protein